MTWRVIEGDCVEAMREMEPNSIDAIVTDPPAGISFMGRGWDSDRSGGFVAWLASVMEEALRVTKPGGHALVWALPRTSHWTGSAIEAAGWEIRDRITHHFGSGFPKSLDVSKAIDRAAGAEREVIGQNPNHRDAEANAEHYERWNNAVLSPDLTAPATPEAQRWQGWGTALKPATEDWWLARKPLIGTVAQNVERFGTGALAIDRCRIGLGGEELPSGSGDRRSGDIYAQDEWTRTQMANGGNVTPPAGRWPANVALSHLPECQRVGERRVKGGSGWTSEDKSASTGYEGGPRAASGVNHADPDGLETVEAWRCAPGCSVAELDRQSGELKTPAPYVQQSESVGIYGAEKHHDRPSTHHGDSGGASRFFATFAKNLGASEPDLETPHFRYVAKASRTERNAGLEGFEERESRRYGDRNAGDLPKQTGQGVVRGANTHPT